MTMMSKREKKGRRKVKTKTNRNGEAPIHAMSLYRSRFSLLSMPTERIL